MNNLENQEETKKNVKDYLSNFNNLPYGIAVAKNDCLSTIINANDAFYKIIGHTKEQFNINHNNHLSSIVLDHFHDVATKLVTFKDLDVEYDIRITKDDASICWIHDFIHYDCSNDIFIHTIIDVTSKMLVTERKLSYEAFQTRNEVISYVSKYTSEHIVVVDIKTDKIIYMNQSSMHLFGFEHESDWVDKTYIEVVFGGNTSDVHPHYYEELTKDFTYREYYNRHHKIYCSTKNKLIEIPSLNRKMRLNIITDITVQKKLENQLALQKTLHDCVDTMFTTASTNNNQENAYNEILEQLKKYYQSDAAFFYKFKEGTNDIEAVYKVTSPGVKSANFNLPITVTDEQIEVMRMVANQTNLNSDLKPNDSNYSYLNNLKKKHSEYNIGNFLCVAINNNKGEIIAYMGVSNLKANENDKKLMELLSRFICMFIEHEQNDVVKTKSFELESLSNTNLVETCVQNFQSLMHSSENITNVLDALCHHYDADFSVVLLNDEHGSSYAAYVGGNAVPNLKPLEGLAGPMINKWINGLETHPDFMSDDDFVDLNAPRVKKILNKKFGIYNFVVSHIKDATGNLVGLLFLNNFKLISRSHLLVHIVAKNISDYLAKIGMYEKTQLEPLTKLTNKVATENQINELLSEGKTGSLFIIDIDNFKRINDTFGHLAGDQTIVEFSNVLKKIFRTTDIIGRVGGDEFMVFTPDLTSHDSVTMKAYQILKSHLYQNNEKITAEINVSIGICRVSEECNTFEALYEKADYALYVSKKNGKNQYHIYANESDLDEITFPNEMLSYQSMVNEIKSAILENRLVVHYQPIYHVKTATYTQAEALVRIKKEDGTLMYPNEFIEIADSTSLSVDMTYKILEQVCYDFSSLLKTNPNNTLTSISINMPYLQFTDPNMEDHFMQILNKYNILPSQIKIEITERTLINDLDLTMRKMGSLMEKGFEFELDDFGIDYSNLQMCISLPLEIIKVDREILLAAFETPTGRKFFQHIVEGIHSTGKMTVLEGVETLEQLYWAVECQCEYVQGYYFSKPVDFEKFKELILEQ